MCCKMLGFCKWALGGYFPLKISSVVPILVSHTDLTQTNFFLFFFYFFHLPYDQVISTTMAQPWCSTAYGDAKKKEKKKEDQNRNLVAMLHQNKLSCLRQLFACKAIL